MCSVGEQSKTNEGGSDPIHVHVECTAWCFFRSTAAAREEESKEGKKEAG